MILDRLLQTAGSRRIFALAVVAMVVVPMWFVWNWATEPAWVTLFEEVEWGTAGDVADQLEAAGIRYQLAAGGTEIQVPASKVVSARVLLAQEGHSVMGRPGMELFDQSTWGMTNFTQRVTFRRALEGELSRTIGRLQGVEQAFVHLSLPEVSPLRALDHPAEAAVVVRPQAGVELANDVVRGIAQLVSNSVEHLNSSNVAVLDDNGRLLSAPTEGNSALGLTSQQLELQQSVEANLSAKAEHILADVLGDGNYKVQVAASLGFERVDRVVESYDPDGAVIQQEDRVESTPAAGTTGANAGTEESTLYLNSRTVETTVGSVGDVERLTVAVLVNEETLLGRVNGNRALMAGQISTLDSLVRSAVGVDPQRGDQFTIAAIPFEEQPVVDVATLVTDQPPAGGTIEMIERFLRPGLGAIGLLFAFALAWRALKSSGDQRPSATQQALPPAPEARQPVESLTAGVPEELGEAQQLRQEILSGGSLPPETASQVVRAWMAEG